MGNGSQFEGRIYEITDLLNPVVIANGTSSAHTQGIAGLVIYDNGGNQGAVTTFDNYVASSLVPPELEIIAPSEDQISLSWPGSSPCFKLQSTTAFLANDWQDVPPGLLIFTDEMFFLIENRGGQREKFYRLVSTLAAGQAPP
jgi:hypothetical protein